MSSCVQVLRAILTGFGRTIHIIGLILLLVLTICMLKLVNIPSTNTKQVIDQMYNQPFESMNKTILLLNVSITLLGTIAAFFDHRLSIKAYSYAATLSASVVILYGVCVSMGFFSGAKDNYAHKLADYQPLYDWQQVPPESADKSVSKRREATLHWDDLQATLCCGISGSADWDKFRPEKLPANLFPRSCCRSPTNEFDGSNYCVDGNELFKSGCLDIPDYLWHSMNRYMALLATAQLALAFIGLFTIHISDGSSVPHLSSVSQQHIAMDFPKS